MTDPSRPRLHIRPEQGWVNDPNGSCRIDGVYHVFFQYNPDAPVHDSIHWGHVSSTDLIRWREEPVALVPRPGEIDAAGCWSGCIVDDAGVPTAVYTAVPDHAGNGAVTLARSDRPLRTWRQDIHPVVGTPRDPEIDEVRDPFVFTFAGRRFAVQGAGHRHGRPQLLLWGCDDLEDWVPLGPLLTADDPVAAEIAAANIWECPNLAYVNDQWVLIVSLWRWRGDTHELAGVRYLLGELQTVGAGLRFRATSGGEIDGGPACYAPQVLTDGSRTLLWGWAGEVGRSDAQIQAAGWAGVLTFPRELSVRDGRLHSAPAAELDGLRQGELDWQPGQPLAAAAFAIRATGRARLRLGDGDGAESVAEVFGSVAHPAQILVDGSIIESFADGRVSTYRAYPPASSGWFVDADPAEVTIELLGLEQVSTDLRVGR